MKTDNKNRFRERAAEAAMDETLRLYGGWLAYLLTRLGEDVIRVPAEDLRHALEHLSCGVTKEGDAYVIYMERAGERGKGGEGDGGQETEEAGIGDGTHA